MSKKCSLGFALERGREGGREGGGEEMKWHIVNIRSIIVNIKPASVRMNGSRSTICLYRNIRLTI